MSERATDATCSLRKTDSVAKALQSHTDTPVKVLLYRLDVAMLRLLSSVYGFLNTRDISLTVLLIILLGEKSMIFQICIKPNSKDYAASPCARVCHLSPSSRHHLFRTIASIAIHDASRDIIAVDRDELVHTPSLENPGSEIIITF